MSRIGSTQLQRLRAGTLGRLILAVMAMTAVMPLDAARAGQASAVAGQAPVMLSLEVGQAHLIAMPGVRRIAVGNGKVIQATALDRRQVLVLPEAPGHSSLHLWPRKGEPTAYQIQVIEPETARMYAGVRALLGSESNLRVRLLGNKVIVEGENPTESQIARLDMLGSTYPGLLNLVGDRVRAQMIRMDVRMVEIKRSALENIGIRWDGAMRGPNFGVVGDIHRGAAFSPGGVAAGVGLETGTGVAPFSALFSIATSIQSMINLLVQNGDAVVLAEPSLSCRSGASARFVAGGEMPIPQTGNLGSVNVQFKEYGVKFDINPVARADGSIRAKVAAEISSIDFEVQVKDVPGLLKRRAETEVALRENETLVIAGLVRQDSARSLDKLPGLGDIPVLGHLFRSRQFREQQTDLVVFITPRFVEDAPSESAAEQTRFDSQIEALRARSNQRESDAQTDVGAFDAEVMY